MFTPTRPEGYVSPGIDTGPGRTKQSQRDQCDIKIIMRQFVKTGMLNFVNTSQGEYMDAPETDYHTAQNIVIEANEMFAKMPSGLRKKFKNDPGEFLEFVHDPKNEDEMYSLGLKERPEGYQSPVVEPTDPPPVETPSEA